ncbi:MAG: hypothetical protein LBG75_01205 [Candidatus Nomurabacteria bacterium]|jgi:signal transduction histidine kinase/uncharacterized membrane protein|nr:hypothetical protein [Candidatus Nomurabacteria bacterium]
MLWAERSILLVAATVAVVIGLVALFQRGSFLRSLFFFISNMACAVWSAGIAVFLSVSDEGALVSAAQVYYIAAAVIAWSLVPLSYVFFQSRKDVAVPAFMTALPLAYIIVMILWRPGSLISSVSVGEHNSVTIDSMGYAVYSLYFVACCSVAAYFLYREAKDTKDRALRRQIYYILGAYAVDFVIGVTFNLIMPWLGNYSLIWIGPINILVLAIMFYWAIIHYKLFDFKELAIRAMSYIMVVAAVAVVYLIVFGFAANMIGAGDVSWELNALNAIMIAVVVMLLPLINKINYHLDKIFHPDGYRLDNIISKLNRVIIKNHDTKQLLVHSARLVNNALGTRFVSFATLRRSQHILVASSPRRSLTDKEALALASFIGSREDRVIFVDTLPEDSEISPIVSKHKVSMLVQIRYQSDTEDGDTVGYMMVGYKVKDRRFSQRDVELLNAASGLVALAIENANYYQQVRSFDENLRKEIAVATSKLRDSNHKLQKFDEAKDEFMSMASHQLRTPLTSIKGYLSMVLDGDGGKVNATQRHFLTEAYQSSNNMLRIINDLLSVSRIQTGKFILDKTNQDLSEIVRHEAGELVDLAVGRGLKIAVQIDDGNYMMNIDELKVRQAIDNLIDNALFYSNDGGTVSVRLSQEPKKIIFKVVDTGIGVPEAEVAKLFTKFSRATNARKRRPDGTGVGLFLVKRVAATHGGGVIIESKENQGSTFGFWLPR